MATLPLEVQATLRKIAGLVSERKLSAPQNDPDLTPARMQLVMRQPPQLVYEFLRAVVEGLGRGDSIRIVGERLLPNRQPETSSLFYAIAPARALPDGAVWRAPVDKDDTKMLPFALTPHGYYAQNFA